jgi:uncharacterized protein (DUF1697 family)
MTRYVAFLRGINVSGQKLIKMEDLRTYMAMPGITNVATYIQSGNVLFTSDEVDEDILRKRIETQLEQKLGYKVLAIIRMIRELQSVARNMPFDTIKTEEKNRLYVTFLADVPAMDAQGIMGIYSNDAEYARIVHKEVYVYSPNYGKTCFSNTFIEKKLGMQATTRNWATVNKLLDL